MEITQAQLDAMIASGEVSLTPPAPASNEAVPAPITPNVPMPAVVGTEVAPTEAKANEVEGLGYTPVKEREYAMPNPRPSRIPLNSKRYYAETKRITKLADKITDPEFANKAIDVLGSGADFRDIDKAVRILAQKDRVRKANLIKEEKRRINALKREEKAVQINMKAEIDRKKAKQKYAVQVGEFSSSLDNLDYLVDEFSDDYVGYGDTVAHNTGRVFNISDPKQSQYKKRFGTLLPNFKELENMGASFTASEQTMLKNIMPEIDSGDTLYRADLVNFVEVLRNKVAGKLNALEDGDYRTGELRKIIGRYDRTLARAKAKFGEDFSENNDLDEQGSMKYAQNEESRGTVPQGFVRDGEQGQAAKTVEQNTVKPSSKSVKFDGSNVADLDALLGL